jgi:hypothetical protein
MPNYPTQYPTNTRVKKILWQAKLPDFLLKSRYTHHGHKIEDISRLIKQYSYFQLFIGWRLKAPRFAKTGNKISPVDFDSWPLTERP